MYHDGWKAVTDHVNQLTAAERDQITGSHDFATDTWALFDTRTDPTESHDLAADEPERLADLVARWFAAAEQNQVFPLDDGAVNRITHMHVPWTASRTDFRYLPGDKVHEVAGPNIAGGFRMVATFADRAPDHGTRRAVRARRLDLGLGVVPRRRRRALVHRRQGRRPHRCRAGAARARACSSRDGALVDGELEVTLTADGIEIVRRNLGVHPPLAWAPDGAFLTVGYARPFPVSDDYAPPATAPVVTRRRHHPRRTAPALRPRRRDRAHPAPPMNAHPQSRVGLRGVGIRCRGLGSPVVLAERPGLNFGPEIPIRDRGGTGPPAGDERFTVLR